MIRLLTAWTLTGSLVGGLLLPLFARPAAADPDGACGPYVVLEHSVEHFEAPLQAPSDHCGLCHYWQAMAGASVVGPAEFLPPELGLNDTGGGWAAFIPRSDRSQSSPRGPPSRS